MHRYQEQQSAVRTHHRADGVLHHACPRLSSLLLSLQSHPLNWTVYSYSLLLKTFVDYENSRTKERAVLQLQVLVDQLSNETTPLLSHKEENKKNAPIWERMMVPRFFSPFSVVRLLHRIPALLGDEETPRGTLFRVRRGENGAEHLPGAAVVRQRRELPRNHRTPRRSRSSRRFHVSTLWIARRPRQGEGRNALLGVSDRRTAEKPAVIGASVGAVQSSFWPREAHAGQLLLRPERFFGVYSALQGGCRRFASGRVMISWR